MAKNFFGFPDFSLRGNPGKKPGIREIRENWEKTGNFYKKIGNNQKKSRKNRGKKQGKNKENQGEKHGILDDFFFT